MVIELVLVVTKSVTIAICKYQNVLINGEEENFYKYQLCDYCCSFDASQVGYCGFVWVQHRSTFIKGRSGSANLISCFHNSIMLLALK